MRTNRRALVLSNESARHPFRRSLPPHVFKPLEQDRPRRFAAIGLRDWREFLAAYCASFVVVTVFIA